jgi:hypothetical protein
MLFLYVAMIWMAALKFNELLENEKKKKEEDFVVFLTQMTDKTKTKVMTKKLEAATDKLQQQVGQLIDNNTSLITLLHH